MIDEKRRRTGVSPRTSVGRTPQPAPTFEVDGEAFMPAADATHAILAAWPGVAPSSAYHFVRRAANAGEVRTVPVGRRRWYHRGDVAQLAARLRSA